MTTRVGDSGDGTSAAPPATPRESPGTPDAPRGLQLAAALSWRGLVVVAALALVVVVLARLAVVTVPVAVAVLLAALLSPPVRALQRAGLPRALATGLVVVLGLGLLTAVAWTVVTAIGDALPDLLGNLTAGLRAADTWLHTGPLRGSAATLEPPVREALALLGGDPASLTGGLATTAVGLALTLGELATGILLVLFVLIFLLTDGAGVWRFALGGLPAPSRPLAHRAGHRGFTALAEHLYGAAVTAVVSAVGVGLGLELLGVPLALPLAALVLVGGFVPVVGPLAAGGLAVLTTLIALGPWRAVAVLVLLVALSLLAHRLVVPALLGRPSPLHPLATVLAVGVGIVLAGVVGALLAVPLLAAARGAADPLRRESLRRASRRQETRRRQARDAAAAGTIES